ncbi:uncharacterized protein AMSG_11573, partial [Thecamonas trahens ATCC 50062]
TAGGSLDSTSEIARLEHELHGCKLAQMELHEKYVGAQQEKNDLMIKLVAAREASAKLEVELADLHQRAAEAESRATRLESSLRAVQAASAHDEAAVMAAAIAQNALETMKAVASTGGKLSVGVEALERIAGVGGSGSGKAPLSPVRAAGGADLELQNASWKSKADNLTQELQVLQAELRKHLSDLRGDLVTTQTRTTTTTDASVVVVENRFQRSGEDEAARAEKRRAKEAERARIEAGMLADEADIAAQRAQLEALIRKTEAATSGSGAGREYGTSSAVGSPVPSPLRARAEVASPVYNSPAGAGSASGSIPLQVTGDLVEGSLLVASPQAVHGASGFRYSWRRRPLAEAHSVKIDHAGPQYTLVLADVDCVLEATATPVDGAGNAVGEKQKVRFGPVEPAPPQFFEWRLLGQPLNTTRFEFEGAYYGGYAGMHEYVWFKSFDGVNWTVLPYPNGPSYQATADDVNGYIRCEVVPVREDGARGSLVGAQSAQILMDPDVEAAVDDRYAAGVAAFEVTMADSFERGKLTFKKNKFTLKTSSESYTYAYAPDGGIKLNPREDQQFQLLLNRDEGFTLNAVPATSRQRDIIAFTHFRYARRALQENYADRDWGQPSLSSASLLSTKASSAVGSEAVADMPEPEPVLAGDGESSSRKHRKKKRRHHSRHSSSTKEAEPATGASDKYQRHYENLDEARARHAERKANMSPAEFAEWRKTRHEYIKSTLTPDEYEAWKEDHRLVTSIKDALGNSIKDAGEDEADIKASVAAMKASMPPEEYAAAREQAKERSLKSISSSLNDSRKHKHKRRRKSKKHSSSKPQADDAAPTPTSDDAVVAPKKKHTKKKRRHRHHDANADADADADADANADAIVDKPSSSAADQPPAESTKKRKKKHRHHADADSAASPAAVADSTDAADAETSKKRKKKKKHRQPEAVAAAADADTDADELEPDSDFAGMETMTTTTESRKSRKKSKSKSKSKGKSKGKSKKSKREKEPWEYKKKEDLTPEELELRQEQKRKKLAHLRKTLGKEEYRRRVKAHNEERRRKKAAAAAQ